MHSNAVPLTALVWIKLRRTTPLLQVGRLNLLHATNQHCFRVYWCLHSWRPCAASQHQQRWRMLSAAQQNPPWAEAVALTSPAVAVVWASFGFNSLFLGRRSHEVVAGLEKLFVPACLPASGSVDAAVTGWVVGRAGWGWGLTGMARAFQRKTLLACQSYLGRNPACVSSPFTLGEFYWIAIFVYCDVTVWGEWMWKFEVRITVVSKFSWVQTFCHAASWNSPKCKWKCKC